MAGIELRNVTVKYRDGAVALRNIRLDVNDKEFIVLTGPPGCGKSAVLRAVANLDRPTEGEILIGGRPANDTRTANRGAEYVSRDYAPHPNMSVYKNMEGRSRGSLLFKLSESAPEQKVRDSARMLGIEHLLEHAAKEVSNGQRRKMALGRAIALEPDIYLIDDLLTGLETKLREQMRLEMLALHRRLQATFIFATRDQAEAMTLGARVILMRDGAVQQADTPANIYRRPTSLFAAGYFGSPQMNFVEAEIVCDGGDVLAIWNDCRIRLGIRHSKAISGGGYIGKAVILGIRPEDLRLDENLAASTPGSVLEARVEHTAMLGSEAILYVSTDGQPLTARVGPHIDAKVGGTVRLTIDADNLHIFDKGTERIITI